MARRRDDRLGAARLLLAWVDECEACGVMAALSWCFAISLPSRRAAGVRPTEEPLRLMAAVDFSPQQIGGCAQSSFASRGSKAVLEMRAARQDAPKRPRETRRAIESGVSSRLERDGISLNRHRAVV